MVSLHVLFETLGMAVGFRYFVFLRKKQTDRINDRNRIWILVGAAFGAFIFSRVVGAFENPPGLMHSGHKLLYLYANKTIVGGLLGGLLMVEITKKIIHERGSSGDLFTYPLILAVMIGRIGCFTSGMAEETYGLPTHSFLGMNMGKADQWLSVPVLYDRVFCFSVLAGLHQTAVCPFCRVGNDTALLFDRAAILFKDHLQNIV